jgi:hypothetical protein
MLLEPDEHGARLDGAGVSALLAAARDEPVDPEAAVTLASGRLDAALAALADPLVSLELVVAGGSVRLAHRGWANDDLVVLLAAVHAPAAGPEGGGEWRLLTMPPDLLTSGLVRLTRIRPRRDPAEPLAGAWRDDLVATDPDVRGRARSALGLPESGFAWRLQATWPTGERLLRAVDGPAGLHLADPAGDDLQRVSNTFCYRVLSTLLPTDPELAAVGQAAAG